MQRPIRHGQVIRHVGVGIQDLTDDLAKEFGVPDAGDQGRTRERRGRSDGEGGGGTRRCHHLVQRHLLKGLTQLPGLVTESEPGTTVIVMILRDKRRRDITVTLGE